METLQWTLLVGLLAMVVYVLWARLRASYARGVAPQVKVDWEGEAVVVTEASLDVHVRVIQAGDVSVSLMDAQGTVVHLHEGPLEAGVHAWSVSRPEEGQWVAKLTTEGHRSERRIQL